MDADIFINALKSFLKQRHWLQFGIRNDSNFGKLLHGKHIKTWQWDNNTGTILWKH